jgi:PAS domain-containing protein
MLSLSAVLLAALSLFLFLAWRRLARDCEAMQGRLRQENADRREAVSLLKLQRDLAVTLGSKDTLRESFDCLLEMLDSIPGVDCGGIYLLQDDGSLELAAHRGLSAKFVSLNSLIAAGSERTRLVLEGRVCSQNYSTLSSDALLEGLRSVLVVPVLFQSKVVAVLNLGSRTVPAFLSPMTTAIEAAAEHIGGIVAGRRNRDTMREKNEALAGYRRNEGDVREERKSLDALIDVLPVGLMVLDDKTRIVRINVAGLAMTGGEPHEILGQRPGDVLKCVHARVSPDGCGTGLNCPVCELRRNVEAVLAVEGSMRNMDFEAQVIREGAPRTVWLRVNAEAFTKDGRKHVLVALQDVTLQKRAALENG